MLFWYDLRPLQYQEQTETVSPYGSTVPTWSTVQNFLGTIQPFFPPHARVDLQYVEEGIIQRVTHILMCNLVINNTPNAPLTNIKYGQRILDPRTGQLYRVEDEQNAAGVNDHYEIPLVTVNTFPKPSGD